MKKPVRYSHALADRVIERLKRGGTLKACCRDEGMPDPATILDWVVKDYYGFSDRYRAAREIGYMLLAEEIIDIADTQEIGEETTEGKDGLTVKRGDMVRHRQLRIDARKWIVSKVLPKVYGPKLPPLPELPDNGKIIIVGGLPE